MCAHPSCFARFERAPQRLGARTRCAVAVRGWAMLRARAIGSRRRHDCSSAGPTWESGARVLGRHSTSHGSPTVRLSGNHVGSRCFLVIHGSPRVSSVNTRPRGAQPSLTCGYAVRTRGGAPRAPAIAIAIAISCQLPHASTQTILAPARALAPHRRSAAPCAVCPSAFRHNCITTFEIINLNSQMHPC